jgi:hypothetical protein
MVTSLLLFASFLSHACNLSRKDYWIWRVQKRINAQTHRLILAVRISPRNSVESPHGTNCVDHNTGHHRDQFVTCQWRLHALQYVGQISREKAVIKRDWLQCPVLSALNQTYAVRGSEFGVCSADTIGGGKGGGAQNADGKQTNHDGQERMDTRYTAIILYYVRGTLRHLL